MIASFRCEQTRKVFEGEFSRKLPTGIQRVAHRKLVQLETAMTLDDLRIPPANRLEALRGKRKGQHSIRINQQWRVCFRWEGDGSNEVEIIDYH
jgi:proteic killer suppression protein